MSIIDTTTMKEIIVQKLQLLSPKLIILFGSFAHNTQNEESDVDIAFYSDKNLTQYERWSLDQNIAIALNSASFFLFSLSSIYNSSTSPSSRPLP